MNQLNAATEEMLPEVKANLKKVQIDLLLSMDKISVLQAALFNILIGNTDWALFGLSRHTAGHRNFKFMKKPGTIIPVAYDFDGAAIANGQVVALSTYKERLSSLKSKIEQIYGSLSSVPLDQVLEDYRQKVIIILSDNANLEFHVKRSFVNFLDATNEGQDKQ